MSRVPTRRCAPGVALLLGRACLRAAHQPAPSVPAPIGTRRCVVCHRARNSAVAFCRLGRHRRWDVCGVVLVLRVSPALVGCIRGAPEAPRFYKKENCSLVLEGVLEWCRSFVAWSLPIVVARAQSFHFRSRSKKIDFAKQCQRFCAALAFALPSSLRRIHLRTTRRCPVAMR